MTLTNINLCSSMEARSYVPLTILNTEIQNKACQTCRKYHTLLFISKGLGEYK